MIGRRLTCFALTAMSLLGVRPAAQPTPAAPCRFPDGEVAWLQRALEGWEQVSRALRLHDPAPLPWILLYDAACVWHLNPESTVAGGRVVDTPLTFAGRAVAVRAVAHSGTFLLPNGTPGEVEMKASTSLYRNGSAAFFAMAMPSVWKSKEVSAPTRAEYLQGVFSHEMTHVRLLPTVNRLVKELARQHDLPSPMNDDVIQLRFEQVSGFEAAINRERDHFYRAVLEPLPEKRARHVRRGLDAARARRDRYFTGADRPYAEIESLFLLLEGVGQWAAYHLSHARNGSEAQSLRLMRDDRRYWSQDEGLALFLLIDALHPDWQSRVFTDSPATPFELLQQAMESLH
jgi:hypothetical protein